LLRNQGLCNREPGFTRYPPDAGLAEAEVAAFDRFWQSQFLGTGRQCTQASDIGAPVLSTRRQPVRSSAIEAATQAAVGLPIGYVVVFAVERLHLREAWSATVITIAGQMCTISHILTDRRQISPLIVEAGNFVEGVPGRREMLPMGTI
jgi:hypothetical protein